MNADAKAITEWERSEETRRAFDRSTLGGSNEFLKNRLYTAFVAGLDAGKKIEHDRILAKIAGFLD